MKLMYIVCGARVDVQYDACQTTEECMQGVNEGQYEMPRISCWNAYEGCIKYCQWAKGGWEKCNLHVDPM